MGKFQQMFQQHIIFKGSSLGPRLDVKVKNRVPVYCACINETLT